ncbi:MAG: hypothetical protein MR270_07750, partial [Erysipelotrichaceae bacterium]|nr:hypothetical protein [Erysipelotrichaceae bacterium]
ILISNLPYYITSKLLNMILLNDLKIDTIITMMQKEVGQKIIKPDKKDYNTLSVMLFYQYDVGVVKYVGKNSYLPRPEIDSIVLKFDKITPRYDVDYKLLLEVSNAIFKARRKTLGNNLKHYFKSDEEANNFYNTTNLSPTLHVEQLTLIDFITICKALKK